MAQSTRLGAHPIAAFEAGYDSSSLARDVQYTPSYLLRKMRTPQSDQSGHLMAAFFALLPRMNYQDGKPRTIDVAIHLKGQYVPCGRIMFNSAANIAAFDYDEDYNGPPLDPINLNYKRTGQRRFMVNSRTSNDLLHRVFIDYLPGPWGLQVLQTEHPELKTMRAGEKLHWFGSRTVGSLAFFVQKIEEEQPVQGIDLLEEIRRRSVNLFLSKIDSIGMGKAVMEGLTSHGGARPKCIFEDRQGGQWLTKFNVTSDSYNVARVEHACSVLAKQCGIDAVHTRCLEIEPGADVLFVRRYDRIGQTRPHRVSAFSMMREDIVRAQNEGDYAMLFELLDKICCDPIGQRDELLRRMMLNIALNNTDDHLKNFELLLDEQRNCWTLSPAYDITVDPYPNPRVTAVFGMKRPSLSDETMNHIANRLDIDVGRVMAIRDQVHQAASKWAQTFEQCGVAPQHLSKLGKAFEYGLNLDREDLAVSSKTSALRANNHDGV